jgi:hypothetical protein
MEAAGIACHPRRLAYWADRWIQSCPGHGDRGHRQGQGAKSGLCNLAGARLASFRLHCQLALQGDDEAGLSLRHLGVSLEGAGGTLCVTNQGARSEHAYCPGYHEEGGHEHQRIRRYDESVC